MEASKQCVWSLGITYRVNVPMDRYTSNYRILVNKIEERFFASRTVSCDKLFSAMALPYHSSVFPCRFKGIELSFETINYTPYHCTDESFVFVCFIGHRLDRLNKLRTVTLLQFNEIKKTPIIKFWFQNSNSLNWFIHLIMQANGCQWEQSFPCVCSASCDNRYIRKTTKKVVILPESI